MNYKRDRKEPFWWGMFSAGGVVAALLVPVHILLHGLGVPLGLLEPSALGHDRLQEFLTHPLVRVYVFILIVLPLYHAAHRIRFSLYELGIRDFRVSMDVLCYGMALGGTASVGWLLLRVL